MSATPAADLTDPERVAAAAAIASAALPPDPELNALCDQVASRVATDTVFINLVLEHGTRAVGQHGLPRALHQSRATRHSVCAVVAANDRPMVMEKPAAEPLLKGCLGRLILSFYAGHPIHIDGRVVGVLAAADFARPRSRRHDIDHIAAVLSDSVPPLERLIAARVA